MPHDTSTATNLFVPLGVLALGAPALIGLSRSVGHLMVDSAVPADDAPADVPTTLAPVGTPDPASAAPTGPDATASGGSDLGSWGVPLLVTVLVVCLVIAAVYAVARVRRRRSHANTQRAETRRLWDEALATYTRLIDAYAAYWTGPQALAEQVLYRPLIAEGIAAGDPEVLAAEDAVTGARNFCQEQQDPPHWAVADPEVARAARDKAQQALACWERLYVRAGKQGLGITGLTRADTRKLERVQKLLDAAMDPANGASISGALDRAQDILNTVCRAHGSRAVDLREVCRTSSAYTARRGLATAGRKLPALTA